MKEESIKKEEETAATQPEKSEVALREEVVLAFWQEHNIFHKTLEKDAPNGDFVFYDGPPFATGLPHYGHILAGTIKDAVPRFWTMNGYRVRRKWGWDCHGLPLENLIEKELGLSTKRDIEEFGIQNFNEKARAAVLRYADDWREIIPRMGRFVDMADDYKTMDPEYTESVWWVFKTLHEKGLVYEGFKSMHLCPRCGTTLSNFEVNLGYKDIKDIAVTVKLPLLDESGEKTDTSLLVWTTTPWTLPGNMAAAVHEKVDYVKVKIKNEAGKSAEQKVKVPETELMVLAKARLEQLGDTEYEVVEEIKGSKLVGKSYEPPFPYHGEREFAGKENAWKIYHAPYVEIGGEGTGAVHLAPAYGEEDMELAKEHGVPIVHHVDESGSFKDFVTDPPASDGARRAGFAGQLVKPKDDDDAGVTHLDTDIEIVKALKASGKLFKKENITHSYPHCWRCDTPLLNYATTSWFVEVTKFRDELVKANQGVHWVPEHVGSNRFGKWLEGARDWAVSRQRYWGAPLPIWRNPKTKEYQVFGSLREIQEHTPKSGNRYFVMRHGESVSNVNGVTNHKPDPTNVLTEKGKKQVKEAMAELKKAGITKIYTSPLPRTTQTAELVAAALGLPPEAVVSDARLLENGFGELEGKPIEEYEGYFPSYGAKMYITPPGGENWHDTKKRTTDLLFEIEQNAKNEKVLFVSHSGTLQMLQAGAQGFDDEASAQAIEDDRFDVKNAEIREVAFTPFPHNDEYELDYHRPYIDQFRLIDTDGTELERIEDVFDCWFESGAMPYAETHYPFGNLEVNNPEKGVRFPADFIAESIDQTRGWFYSLMVLGVGLFGKSPYQNVITNGLVLAEDGRKMSKKLQNYPDPQELVARQGADTMRFYLLSSSIIKGEDLNFSEKEVAELQRKNIGRLHNVLAMYELYADGTESRSDSVHVLDRWILARLNQLIAETTTGYQNYELDRATRPLTDFIDDLSVWYLRRSRDRLKGVSKSGRLAQEVVSHSDDRKNGDNLNSSCKEDETDKQATLATLRFVLQQVALVMAPPMPFYAEYLWGRVKDDKAVESVHLAEWPKAEPVDTSLLEEMQTTRQVVSLALEQRAKAGLKVRQPLASLRVKHELRAGADEYIGLIKDEVNVKEVISDKGMTDEAALDTTITPELQAEGDARELMRAIQDLRKKAGLEPKDHITLTVQTSDGGEALIEQFMEEIKRTVGATTVAFGDADGTEVTAGEYSFTIELAKK